MPRRSKVDRAIQFITEFIGRSERPVVLWSGGKDSQVLLWLARQAKIDIPAVYFQIYPDARKEAFIHEIAGIWKQQVQTLRPIAHDVAANGSNVELLNFFRVGDIVVHVGMQSGNVGAKPICLIETCTQPTSNDRADCDLAFIGHKDSDVDTLYGHAILSGDTVRSGDTTLAYPLRDWTDEDIWEASEQFSIEQNWRRYDRQTKEKLKSEVFNNDYYALCSKCCAPGLSVESVLCPKIGVHIAYLGDQLPLQERYETYRRSFINIKGYDETHTQI